MKRFRFRIVHLMLLVAIFGAFLTLGAVVVRDCQQKAASISYLSRLGADIWLDYHIDPNTQEFSNKNTSSTPKWLCDALGMDPFATVVYVNLSGRKEVHDEDIKHLVNLKGIKILDISYTNISSRGLRYVSNLSGLKSLCIDGTSVRDSGIESISGLTAIEELSIDNTAVTDGSISTIIRFRKLKYLRIHGTSISAAGTERLRRELAGCTVEN
jgi:Leucine-rich repeat (LRR) protein